MKRRKAMYTGAIPSWNASKCRQKYCPKQWNTCSEYLPNEIHSLLFYSVLILRREYLFTMREQAYYRYLPLASRWRFQLLVGSIWHICGWMCSRYAYQLCDHPSNGKQDKGCHQLRHIQNQHRGNCMVLSCIALRVLSCCSMGRFLGTPNSSTCREAQVTPLLSPVPNTWYLQALVYR